MNSRTALMLGGSGLVGRFCLNALLGDPIYERVLSISRRELPHASNSKLTQKIVPFDDLSSLNSLTLPQVDDVFCALGTTIRKAGSQAEFRRVDLAVPVAIAQQAVKSGAQQFILVSSVGADPRSKNFYLRIKGEVEQAVTSSLFKAVHILRPSLLLGVRGESRPGETIAIGAARVFQFLCVGLLRRYHPIPAIKVGQAMVAAAKSGRQGTNVYEYDGIIAI
jgi:uncharacterized protein YbjT (DUF2867 family)